MAKNSKLELKKEYMNKLLFKDDDKLVVYKLFIHKGVLITTEKFKINREGVTSYQCEPKELTNKLSIELKYCGEDGIISLVKYKIKENIFKLININSTKDGNKTITKTLSTSIKLDEVPYWGFVLMNKSYPPILILDTDPTVKEKNPLELIKNDQCKISSLREKMTIKTETKVTEVSKCNCTPIGISFENYYVNSSYSKEDIKYDDNGEVIYYRNDINKVKFYVEDNYKLTFVDGVLVNMLYCDPEDKVLVTEFLGKQIITKLDDTHSSIICNGKAHDYYKNDELVDFTSDSSYLYKPEFKRPHINSINTDTGIVDYFVDNHIFCKELKNNNKDEQESIITTKYYDSDCNILMVHSPDTFKSKSGVNYRWTCNSDKFVYSDNDIQVILDNSCQLIDYKHNLLTNQKYVYIRDNFGVPFKFADLEVN